MPGRIKRSFEGRSGVLQGAKKERERVREREKENKEMNAGRSVLGEAAPQFGEGAARQDHEVCIGGRKRW